MDLQQRINLMVSLGEHISGSGEEWQNYKVQAEVENSWFIPQFINLACDQIAKGFLQKDILEKWAAHYHIDNNIEPKKIGIVMAGNIPLVGFHDFLCCFICGHISIVKLSSKDNMLFKGIYDFLYKQNEEISKFLVFQDRLNNSDAYIATGSNNTGRYFESYFGKYPNIIRKNRTSIAILTGKESAEELSNLADDIHLYFGLGCRNVTKIFVPKDFDFVSLLNTFKQYAFFGDHHKFRNNYDYQLSILLLGNVKYMSDESTLLVENESTYSPISIVHYEYYEEVGEVLKKLNDDEIQCVVGKEHIPFGEAQHPSVFQYADGVDTMQFLLGL